MRNPKWEIGPVKLANGWEATIYRYCENRNRYIGEARDKDGWFFAGEWMADGSWYIKNSPCNSLSLAPPPKKTVKVQTRWFVVYPNGGTSSLYLSKEMATADAIADEGFALREIPAFEIEEGSGL